MKNNIFEKETVSNVIARINALNEKSTAEWGKMNAAQMLAHCNVAYELHHEKTHKAPSGFEKLIMKLFVKKIVVSNKPYARNNRSAPQMVITEEKDFSKQQSRLVNYVKEVQELGFNHFNGKESFSFGKLSTAEWSTLFYKHLDHHLVQFGV